ncbi:MAG: ATP-binding cassette domain-containing protein [Peptoniphilaceae bacterium]|nr:ATP-binding cassette domain-containing protein [Peptoniphilaceae bacterium]MDD7383822.1 ATP-binding cassette domain-containing protein [Peptoniphilaceae bacterium]MDY3737601.1 ATP-binding cassette domain-containing protein [Peptoniphilaceae bacterium]
MFLEAKDISFKYEKKGKFILKGLSLKIDSKKITGILAPSGYGKSTLAKILSGYELQDEGEVSFDNKALPKKSYNPVQLIYQHPEFAVNPKWKMKKTLNEVVNIDKNIIKEMGIKKEWLNRFPNELSLGELQRFCIARVLNNKTKFLICDEITSMLDSINQAQIWKYLINVSNKKEIGLLVITHNINLAKKICDEIIFLEEVNNIN